MKKLVTLLFLLISFVTYSQTGVGYLNYTVYNIASNGAGQYANNATDFVNMFDVSKGARVYATGTSTAQKTLYFSNGWQPSGVPNGGAYTGIKVTGYFVPAETGTYSFGIDGDDGVDFLLDGTVITSFYGPHGFAGYHYGTVNLIAGKSYEFMARYQNWGGGWGMYLVWKRPSQSTWSIQSTEVTSTPPATPTKKAVANFNLNTNLTATTFAVGSSLSSAGSVDITTSLDSNKVNTGYKSTITAGGAEWSYVNPNASWLGGNSRLLIDDRQFGNVDPTTINSVKILDVYDGPVTFVSNDGTWAVYTVPSPLTKVTDGTSIYNSSIRNVNGWNTDYAFTCGISFGVTQAYKTQSISLTTTNTLSTLYNSIVTVSDVYLAFKELANGGIFGNQSGNEFSYGIQYKNADVNDDGYFNEADCFALLQNLTGAKTLVDTFNLNKTMRIIPQLKYDSIGKSNWTSFTTPLGSSYSFDINTGKTTDTINLAVAWKGDVNLSHSTTPKSNNLTTMSIPTIKTMMVSTDVQASIITELKDGKFYAYITFDPLQQQVVGTQFQLNYDNSILTFESVEFKAKGNPMNYGTNTGKYINFGSLVTDGSTLLDNTTQYVVSFTPTKTITNGLGLIAISTTDAVNKAGKQLNLKVN